jgi:magnesium transporter
MRISDAQLVRQLDDRDLAGAKETLAALTPADLARRLPALSTTQRALAFRLLEKEPAAAVFDLLSLSEEVRLLQDLTHSEAVGILAGLDPEDQDRLLDEAPASVAGRLLAALSDAERDRAATVLSYPRGSAGALAHPRYLSAAPEDTAQQVLDQVRASGLRSEDLSTVFVTDAGRRYQGLVTLPEIVRAGPTTRMSAMARLAGAGVPTGRDAGEAVRLLQARDLGALPVTDSEGRLVGAVTADEAMDELAEDASETMYRKAGLGDPAHARELLRSERLTSGPILYPVRVRISFLLVTLAGGLMVGGLIERFEDVLAAVVAVAVFVPLIMDMGGNVGTQSTTIFARGLALGHIDPRRFGRQLLREVRVGACMALVLATVGGTIAYLWQGAPNGIPLLGLAVGISLFTSVTLATFLGFALPWIMLKLGLDHAPGADPFITTIKDFTGLAVYFGLAATLLGVG